MLLFVNDVWHQVKPKFLSFNNQQTLLGGKIRGRISVGCSVYTLIVSSRANARRCLGLAAVVMAKVDSSAEACLHRHLFLTIVLRSFNNDTNSWSNLRGIVPISDFGRNRVCVP